MAKRYYTLGIGFWLPDDHIDTAKAARSLLANLEERIGELGGEIDDAEVEHQPDMDKEE